jgi:hypothetical protein
VTLRICNITHRLSSVKLKHRLLGKFFSVACASVLQAAVAVALFRLGGRDA